jgi:hypothetical protein
MTSVVDGEVKKQKGAFNYDLYELKLDFLISVIRKHQQPFVFLISEYKFAIR